MLTITKEDVERIFAELVEEKGADYRYDGQGLGCVYAYDDGAPACIVGHLVAKLDLGTLDDIVTHGLNEDTSVDGLVDDGIFFSEHLVTHALQVAQEVQDRQGTWDEARRAAEWVLSQPERFGQSHFDLYLIYNQIVNELEIDTRDEF